MELAKMRLYLKTIFTLSAIISSITASAQTCNANMTETKPAVEVIESTDNAEGIITDVWSWLR